jgi:hypothetical protein
MIALSIYLDPTSKKLQSPHGKFKQLSSKFKIHYLPPDPERILEIYYFRVVASDEFEIEHQISGSQSHAPRHSITRSSVRENTAIFLRKLIMLQVCQEFCRMIICEN